MEKDNPPITGGPAREHHKKTTDPQESEISGNVFEGLANKTIMPDQEDRREDARKADDLPQPNEKENSPG